MALDYHTRMIKLYSAVNSGQLGRVEVAAVFTGAADKPWYVALRDCETAEVRLLACDSSASFSQPAADDALSQQTSPA